MKNAVRELERRRKGESRNSDRVARKLAVIVAKIRALRNTEWEHLSSGDDALLQSITVTLDQMEQVRR